MTDQPVIADRELQSGMPLFERWYLPGVLGLATGVGVLYALFIPHGLPYDEPSHWATVLYYGAHHSLPVLGAPGITYTAEHPPVPYIIGAIVQRVAQALGASEWGQIVAVRLVFGLAMLASIALLDRILRRIGFDAPARAIGLVLFALAPINLAIFWSVQNDGMLVVMTLLIIDRASSWAERDGPGPMHTTHYLWLGLLLGLALLVKITAFWVVIGVMVWLAWRALVAGRAPSGNTDHRWQQGAVEALRAALFTGLATLAVCGWWFIWNLATYGNITGSRVDAGLPGPTGAGINGPSTIEHLGRNVVTYLWVPNEYFRNQIRLGPAADVALLLATAALCASAAWTIIVMGRRARRGKNLPLHGTNPLSILALIGLVFVASVCGWAMLYLFVEAFPARIGIPGLVLIVGVGGPLAVYRLPRLWQRRVLGLCVAAILVGSIWALYFAHQHSSLSEQLMNI